MARYPTPAVYSALYNAAKQTGVPITLLMGVAFAESGFDPTKTGAPTSTGEQAQGLMQLLAATRARYGVTDGYNAMESALGGGLFLATLAKALKWDVPAMLAAYVWGPTRYAQARAAGQAIPADVERYVTRVRNAQHYYRTQAPRPRGTLMHALDASIRALAALNPQYPPTTSLLNVWQSFYAKRRDDTDTAATLNPSLKKLWQAYSLAYERAPITDDSTPYPSDVEPDFWGSAARAVDNASKAITHVAEQAAVGVGAGLFLVAVFLFAVSRHRGGSGGGS